jgi:hypothetical protein
MDFTIKCISKSRMVVCAVICDHIIILKSDFNLMERNKIWPELDFI